MQMFHMIALKLCDITWTELKCNPGRSKDHFYSYMFCKRSSVKSAEMLRHTTFMPLFQRLCITERGFAEPIGRPEMAPFTSASM
jgi:hypothetical protein